MSVLVVKELKKEIIKKSVLKKSDDDIKVLKGLNFSVRE